jgi:hypothetical protein
MLGFRFSRTFTFIMPSPSSLDPHRTGKFRDSASHRFTSCMDCVLPQVAESEGSSSCVACGATKFAFSTQECRTCISCQQGFTETTACVGSQNGVCDGGQTTTRMPRAKIFFVRTCVTQSTPLFTRRFLLTTYLSPNCSRYHRAQYHCNQVKCHGGRRSRQDGRQLRLHSGTPIVAV